MVRRSLGRRRWRVVVPLQWQIAEAASIEKEKFETLAVPLTRPPVPMLFKKAAATTHSFTV